MGGPPNVYDIESGKRPGTFADYEDFMRLAQSFDVIHLLNQCVEPLDLPVETRHLDVTLSQLLLTEKVPFVYARGRGQVADCFAMFRIARRLDEADFAATPCTYTVVNTNSPLQLDIPMALGIIDFARAGQLCIVTPFTLAGAMAPITILGALVQQHAEALAGLTLGAARPAGRAGSLRRFHFERRHAERGACLRHAGIGEGVFRERPACSLPRPSLARLERQCLQCSGRAGCL